MSRVRELVDELETILSSRTADSMIEKLAKIERALKRVSLSRADLNHVGDCLKQHSALLQGRGQGVGRALHELRELIESSKDVSIYDHRGHKIDERRQNSFSVKV